MNAYVLSRLPCQLCGKVSHTSSTLVGMLTSSDMSCGYSPQQLRDMQLTDECTTLVEGTVLLAGVTQYDDTH